MYQRFHKRFSPQEFSILLCLILAIIVVTVLLGIRFFPHPSHETLEEKYSTLFKNLGYENDYPFDEYHQEYSQDNLTIFPPQRYFPCQGEKYARFFEVSGDPEKACSLVITTLPELHAFQKISHSLKNLKMLKITKTPITNVPPEISQLSKLELLVIRDTQRTTLPSEIGNLGALTKLTINNVHLASLPTTIGNLHKLKNLTVYGNKEFRSLSPEICNIKELLYLDLGKNSLRTLPDSLVNCTHLKELYLNDNSFIDFPSVIVRMPQVTIIDISNNMIKVVPNNFMNRQLVSFYMSNNRLTSFPSLAGQKNMYYLDLSGNKITYMPELPQNGKLVILDISYNQLTSIPSELSKFSDLENLYFDHNHISSLPLLDRLTQLQQLYAGDNQLTALSSLGTLTKLEILDIRNNKLSSLPEGLEHLHKIRELSIEGNNFKQAEIEKVKKLFPYTPITY